MLNISFQEGVIIFVTLILFVKPDDLPVLAFTIGRMFQRLRLAYIRFTDDLMSEYESKHPPDTPDR